MPDETAKLQAVIDALLKVKGLLVEAYEPIHSQEHLWEVLEYPGLEKWFDKLNRDLWCLHHRILKRVFKLGGRPDGVTDDESAAFNKALSLLQGIHAACQEVYDVAEEADDYVTEGKLEDIQGDVEAWIVSARAKLAQIERLKEGFMEEQL